MTHTKTPENIRNCVMFLAHRATGMSLTEWSPICNTLLHAADIIEAQTQALHEALAYMTEDHPATEAVRAALSMAAKP